MYKWIIISFHFEYKVINKSLNSQHTRFPICVYFIIILIFNWINGSQIGWWYFEILKSTSIKSQMVIIMVIHQWIVKYYSKTQSWIACITIFWIWSIIVQFIICLKYSGFIMVIIYVYCYYLLSKILFNSSMTGCPLGPSPTFPFSQYLSYW